MMKLGSLRLLNNEEIMDQMKYLQNWEVFNFKFMKAIFDFKDFADALKFVIKVGNIAETMQHHPEIMLSPGKVEITIFTEDSGGLTELDFEFAKKVNKISINNV